MSLFKSVTGIAKNALGSVSKFRQVLEVNPQAIPFVLPPQVQMGLTIASKVNSALGGKLKVPTASEVEALAKGQLDLILKGARREVLDVVNRVQNDALLQLGKAEEVLNRIDWLL